MAQSLYIHIPFCIKKCSYCDFISIPFDKTLEKQYVDSLRREIGLQAAEADSLKTIYIGGGTPTLLNAQSFKEIFNALHERFQFLPDMEITAEANPGTIDGKKASSLLSMGVNRLSIGIQSFNETELSVLGRSHTVKEALASVNAVKQAGVKNLSIDLIYGIPGQTLENWSHTIERTLELIPQHISAYELTPNEGTPFYEALKENLINIPEEDMVIDMFNYASDALSAHGFKHYEISNHALKGCECRHNLNYWLRGEYIGVGAGAHSFINGRRLKNEDDVSKYISLLSEGVLPVTESTELTSFDSLEELIFLGMRMADGINLSVIKEKCPELINASEGLINEGMLELNRGHLRLTRKGMLISNSVIVELFDSLR